MNIAFDARYLSMVIAHRANPEMLMGIGSYSYNLIKQLCRDFPEDSYFLICDQAAGKIAAILPQARVIEVPRAPQLRFANATLGRLYRGAVFDRAVLRLVLKDHKIDILHYLSQDCYVPLGTGAAIAVTVHDLANNLFPAQAFKAKSAEWVWNHQTRRLGRADFIIADSEATRTDVLKFCRARPERTATVHCGRDDCFSDRPEAGDEGVLLGYGLKKPYFLHVGGIQPSKNIENLAAGFRLFAEKDPSYHLVLAGELEFGPGEKNRLMNLLKEKGILDKTFLPGFISQEHLPAVYRGAEALVHPSWYEGFGLTPVEAAACGCPVMISDRGSLPEIMGQAALYVDPGKPQSIAEAMGTVIGPNMRAGLVERGLAQAARYSWAKTAREVSKIYQSLK
jgi:glycosyltransferase involved in cell wall biosynthesis